MAEEVVIQISAQDVSAPAFRQAEANVSRLASSLDAANAKVRAMGEAMGRFSDLQRLLGRVSLATGAVAMGIGGLIVKAVATQAQFEAMQKRLEVILGEQMGKKIFRWATEFASRTSYDVGEVVEAVTALASAAKASGVDIKELTKTVSDIAVVSGRSIVDIALAVGRAVGGETQSIRELTRGMVTVSLKGLEDVENKAPAVVKQIMEQGRQYAGMTEKMGQSTALLWTNLGDAITRVLWSIGQIFDPLAKRIIVALTGMVNWVGKFVEKHPLLTKIALSFAGITSAIIAGAAAAGAALLPILSLAMAWRTVAIAAGHAAAAQTAAATAGIGGGIGGIAGKVLGGAGAVLGGLGKFMWGGILTNPYALALLGTAGAAYLGFRLGLARELGPFARAQAEVGAWQERLAQMTPEERRRRIWGLPPRPAFAPTFYGGFTAPVVVRGDILPAGWQDEQMMRNLQAQFGGA